jgi:hypothetical protein
MNAGSKALHMNSQSINKPILFYMQKQPKYWAKEDEEHSTCLEWAHSCQIKCKA